MTCELLHAKEGHFVLESGLHTDRWYALDALFSDSATLAPQVEHLSRLIDPHRPAMICGPMTGGALLAQAVAAHMGLRFVWTQRSTTAPTTALFSARYDLPATQRAVVSGQRIALVDDMISAGSATRASLGSLTGSGAVVVVIGALYLMGDEAPAHFSTAGVPLVAVERRPFHLWQPDDCPLCRRGEPWSTQGD